MGMMKARQAHFHFPSEHKIDGKRFAGEMHVVHENMAGELAVLAFMIEKSPSDSDNEFLQQIRFPSDPKLAPKANVVVNLKTSFEKQLKGDFYLYDGSTTTPPCKEGTHWIVMKTPIEI